MKQICSILLLIIGLQLAAAHVSSAQKMIRIDEQLKANSQPLTVQRKGIKYVFGSYKMISGKAGMERQTIRGSLFGSSRTLNDSTHMSFTLINNEADTCTADIRRIENVTTDIGNLFSRTFLNWRGVEIMKGEGVFEAVFTFSADTQVWRLALVPPLQ